MRENMIAMIISCKRHADRVGSLCIQVGFVPDDTKERNVFPDINMVSNAFPYIKDIFQYISQYQ